MSIIFVTTEYQSPIINSDFDMNLQWFVTVYKTKPTNVSTSEMIFNDVDIIPDEGLIVWDYIIESSQNNTSKVIYFDTEHAISTTSKNIWYLKEIKVMNDLIYLKRTNNKKCLIPNRYLQSSIRTKQVIHKEVPFLFIVPEYLSSFKEISKKPSNEFELYQLSYTGGTTMAIFKVYVADKDNLNWKVTAATMNDTASNDNTIKFSSAEAYDIINDALNNDKEVLIPKGLNVPIVPDVIIVNDLSNDDALNVLKNKYGRLCRIVVSENLGSKPFTYHIDFYRFNILNNIFNSKGFYITEENKDDIYTNILAYAKENGDDKILDQLVEYIELMDALSKVYRLNNLLESTIQSFTNANSLEEIEKVYNDFKISASNC